MYGVHYGGCSSAPPLLPGSSIPLVFLPVSPNTLQLILPFAWAAHMAAISYFITALHSLFISIHISLLACLRSFSKAILFLLSRFSLWVPIGLNIATVMLKATQTAYLLCCSPQTPALRKCFYFANRKTEAHQLKLFAMDYIACEPQDIA